MKRILLLLLVISAYQLKSQCFEIQSILVDACAGPQEGQNEMVVFQVGSTALNVSNLTVAWPNNSWLGITQNAGTAADVATVNATIVGCGLLKEPVAGVLPAHSKVLLVTSTAWSPLAQSFVNLTDTLIIIFQTAGNTAGHFANYAAGGGTRTLTMTFSSPAACSDVVTYDRALLLKQNLTIGAQDGGAVEFTPAGVPTYVNHGCQAPYIPLSVDAGLNHTICAGSTQSFTAIASGNYTSVQWSLGSGATGTFTPTNSLSTTYSAGTGDNGTIKLYCTLIKSCGTQTATVKDSVDLTITPLPILTLTPNTINICAGQSATVNATANTAVTYTWSTSANTNTVSLNSSGVYTCNVSNACGTDSKTVTVALSAVPSVSVTSTSPSICASGQTATLSLSGSSGTYNWSNGGSSSTTTINAPGVYTATVTTPSCGSATISINVGTSPLPTISISVPSTTVCSGSSLTFTANSSDANYQWTGGATTQTVSVNTPSISVTTTNTCGSAQASQTLNIIVTPTISVDNANVNLCSGQTATITATTNATTYTWQPGGINTNTISLNTAGNYSVSTNNICGVAIATVDVVVTSVPTITLVSTSASICASGQTATLSLSGSSGTYSWSNGGSSSSTTINAPGVYTATVATPSCGTATTSINVGTSPLPTISISVPSTTLCSGSSLTFTANSSDANYQWSGGATTQTVSVNTSSIVVTTTNACGSAQSTQTLLIVPLPLVTLSANSISLCSGQSGTVQANVNTPVNYSWTSGATTNTVSFSSSGVYTVNVSNACGNASDTVSVSVSSLPSVSVSATQTLLCSAQTATLSLTGSVGSYLWSNGATTATTSISSSGVYSVTVTASCGQATSSVSITALATPTISVTPSSNILCPGSSATLTATSNLTNYQWSSGGNTNVVFINTPGVVTASVSNACGTATASANISSVNFPPLVLTSSNSTICPNGTATLTVNGGVPLTSGGAVVYAWSNSSTTGSVVTTNGGNVTVSNTNVCGTSTTSINVSVVNLNANISANPVSGIAPVVIDFTNNSVGANTYLWNFGNGQSANTQTVSSQSYSIAGTYMVYLLVTNGSCSDIDSLSIEVLNEAGTLVIPNVFTPNGDFINDVFKVTGVNIVDFDCIIFDRWGLKMFAWDGIKNGWNGKSNDKEVPAGTYFYIINAKDINGNEIKKQGTCTLFR